MCTLSNSSVCCFTSLLPWVLSYLRQITNLPPWCLPAEPCSSLHPSPCPSGPPVSPLDPKFLKTMTDQTLSQSLVKYFLMALCPLVVLKGAEGSDPLKVPVGMALSQMGVSACVLKWRGMSGSWEHEQGRPGRAWSPSPRS